MHNNIPLSLYIHIPWCEKKCPYCDFNSHLKKTEHSETDYINALINDFRNDAERYKMAIAGRKIQTIFIGGGTPSLFKPESFERLLSALQQHIAFTDDIEITLEANPGSSEADKFMGFRQAGINRLSIGVQSFNNTHLKALGRVHHRDHALKAAGFAAQAGFNNFNLDLMFGLPEQSLEQCLSDISQAIALKPTHLSCYQLTIEPNTLFHHAPPITPDDDSLWEMQSALQENLALAAYEQYEVSAYALADKQCRHNLNYWQFGDYLAIGAGAHGKLTHKNSVQRFWKIKHPTQYLQFANDFNQINKLTGEVKSISDNDRPFEFMLNTLRLKSGFDLELFSQRTGLQYTVIQEVLNKHKEQGLIVENNNHIQATEYGFQFLNSMLEDYIIENQT